ncbi:MAG: 4-hydroxy-3-methylbut-2-en-1-yl diphosphate synthase [Firmicutes bacterium CAG:176_59_8]|nr:MAG: 4-hydroxy-3-methylbut-2-en-1-yl diphosphate synthase [Firmicutes bacterium CAG:176_59_8]
MTRQVHVGPVAIGGGAPVSIQSMCNTPTENVDATVAQILRLEQAGCDIVRVAVPTREAAMAIPAIKSRIHIPLVADIHFDYKLALLCIDGGVDKIRINPGNIGSPDRVRAVVDGCRERGIPIRVGVNGGSLEKDILRKYGGVTAEALAESALGHVRLLEDCGFRDVCISVKCSHVPVNMAAYRLLHERTDYPLHLGVTEAGTPEMGVLKSAIGIGGLLCMGVGDTLRVSLTADPVEEVIAAKRILQAAGIRRSGPDLISCPTCGRTKYDMIPIAREVERRLRGCDKPITVAVMGCVVNGPGEASGADVGIAGGIGEGLLFAKGKILRKVPQEQLVDALFEEIDKL